MTLGSIEAQDFSKYLIDHYSQYREPSLSHRRFKHRDLVPLIEKLPAKGFQVKEIGKSYLGKSIYSISIGTGPIKVLLWSQMHGDEATATMALFDIFNFLGRTDLPQVKEILSQLTLVFVPMLNPDGADIFQRRTAQGIDMNRDAVSLTCPESHLLKSLRDSLAADWGFNLHDQNIYYNVEGTENTATISVLAPAYNQEKEVNGQRADAMKLIAVMNEALQDIIPGQVGKYDDTFEPRAFGDNMQKWGTRTILIESGGFIGDPEKQIIRKLNFVAMLTAIQSIASSSYDEYPVQKYWDIPMNNSNLNDVMIRQVTITDQNGSPYQVDIAIRREEFDRNGGAPLYYKGTIEDLGDLSTQYGYQEIDGKGLEYAPGKIYQETIGDLAIPNANWINDRLQKGFTNLKFELGLDQDSYGLPFDVVGDGFVPQPAPKVEQPATFLLLKQGEVKYAVVNGFIYDVGNTEKPSGNGWIYK